MIFVILTPSTLLIDLNFVLLQLVTYLGNYIDALCDTNPEKWSNLREKSGLSSFFCQSTEKRDNSHRVDFDEHFHPRPSSPIPAVSYSVGLR